MRIPAILVAALTLAACDGRYQLPTIFYDAEPAKPAAILEPPPELVAQPLPEPPPPPRLDPRPPTKRVAAANRAALFEPTAQGYVNAIQIYPFTEGSLYRLYAAPGLVSDIALQAGEAVAAISAGDTLRWVIGDTASGSGDTRRVHVLVKPVAAGLKTNLVIATDRRLYRLELESTDHTAMAALSWTYGEEVLRTRTDKPAPNAESGLALDRLRFRYAITGDSPPWRPLRAFDDGSKVYIEFPARLDQGEAPPLFILGADGGTELVNYRVKGSHYIVDRLFAAAELRLGRDPQQVVRIARTDGETSR